MTTQPYTAEQMLAAFSTGPKDVRIKVMAQEIAGLANRQTELNRHIAYLEQLIDANGGREALDLSQHISEAQAQLEIIKQESKNIESTAHARAHEITESARQSLEQQKAELRQEAIREAQGTIEAEIAKRAALAENLAIEKAEKEAQKILSEARADAFRVANKAWLEAQKDGNIPPSGVLAASARLRQEIGAFGTLSNIPGKFIFSKAHESTLRETRPHLDNCIELIGKPTENGSTILREMLGRIRPLYHQDNGDESRKVSVEVDGKTIGWFRQREAEYYRDFLLALESLDIEVYLHCTVGVSSSEKRGSLSSKVDIELFPAVPIQRTMPSIRNAIIALGKSYPDYSALS